MANQPAYIWAIVFSSIGLFLTWFGYKLLVPVFNMTVGSVAPGYPAMVNNNPTYVNGFNTIVSEVNILFQYSFAVIGLGIVAVFVVIFAYRTVFGSTAASYEEAY